jgi:outer membrane protein OmpA-like peptidoglycan-associated protein
MALSRYLLIPLACSVLFSTPVLAAKPDKSDHPLVSPYAGSTVYSKDMKQFDEYKVFKGWDKAKEDYIAETLEGKVTRLLYTNPPERSVLEIYRNYETALKKEGVEVLWECNQANKECMDRYVGAYLRRDFNINGIGNKSGRYMFARLEQADQTAYLALAIGDKYTDVHVIEIKRMDADMASVNLDILLKGIDKEGFVAVDGIYFDTDKTDLKPESDAALKQVAKLLTERPDLNLYVVGHTDMEGSLTHNLTLSKGRATSVVSALVKDHSIAASRLEGHGVGPLAPVASNSKEGGRTKNRRVVLVQRMQ